MILIDILPQMEKIRAGGLAQIGWVVKFQNKTGLKCGLNPVAKVLQM